MNFKGKSVLGCVKKLVIRINSATYIIDLKCSRKENLIIIKPRRILYFIIVSHLTSILLIFFPLHFQLCDFSFKTFNYKYFALARRKRFLYDNVFSMKIIM